VSFQSQSYVGDKSSSDGTLLTQPPSAIPRTSYQAEASEGIAGTPLKTSVEADSRVVVLRMEVSPEKQAKLNELNWMWDGRPPDKFGWGISKNKTTEYGNTIYHLEVPTGLDKPSKTPGQHKYTIFREQLENNLGAQACQVLGTWWMAAMLRQYRRKLNTPQKDTQELTSLNTLSGPTEPDTTISSNASSRVTPPNMNEEIPSVEAPRAEASTPPITINTRTGEKWVWNGRPEKKHFWGVKRNETVKRGNFYYLFEIPVGLGIRNKARTRTVFMEQFQSNVGDNFFKTLTPRHKATLLRQYQDKERLLYSTTIIPEKRSGSTAFGE
jgi:hypothetical protein